jgi:hypothetical protein
MSDETTTHAADLADARLAVAEARVALLEAEARQARLELRCKAAKAAAARVRADAARPAKATRERVLELLAKAPGGLRKADLLACLKGRTTTKREILARLVMDGSAVEYRESVHVFVLLNQNHPDAPTCTPPGA